MKTHLSFATRDLAASVAFYRTLLDAEPTKRLDDYAVFITERPGLELALEANTRAHAGGAAHFGIVVDRTEDVDAAIARWESVGAVIEIEREETCCYAVQNKVWATDPDGRRWETYFVVAEANDATRTCC